MSKCVPTKRCHTHKTETFTIISVRKRNLAYMDWNLNNVLATGRDDDLSQTLFKLRYPTSFTGNALGRQVAHINFSSLSERKLPVKPSKSSIRLQNSLPRVVNRKSTFPKQNQRFLCHSWLSERTVLEQHYVPAVKGKGKVKFTLLQKWSRGVPLLFL